MWAVGPITFGLPWILVALLSLPLVWWLLRVTPPAPKIREFPAIRLILGIKNVAQTPQASPWWLIILRMFIISAVIIGLADPQIKSKKQIKGSGPILLIIDNGWSTSHDWDVRVAAIKAVISKAEWQDRSIAMITTAQDKYGQTPRVSGPFSAKLARSLLASLNPYPWPEDRKAALHIISKYKSSNPITSFWFSNGLKDEDSQKFVAGLQRHGSLSILASDPSGLPIILFPPKIEGSKFTIRAQRAYAAETKAIRVGGRTEDGRLLIEKPIEFLPGKTWVEATFELPIKLRNQLTRMEILGHSNAAAVSLLDNRWHRRSVGLISSQNPSEEPAFLSEHYFLERAFAPFSLITRAPVAQLLKTEQSIVILPDAEATTSKIKANLDRWIRNGGILLRFAGPRLAAKPIDNITPVLLRKGKRTLGGNLDWNAPLSLAEFGNNSAFHGLHIPKDIKITSQILAQPSLDLPDKTWASLVDGTPLVTAEKRGRGWLILFHTTANTAWGNMSLSGLFVKMMRRIVWLSQNANSLEAESQQLYPLQVLDAKGYLKPPDETFTPIRPNWLDGIPLGPSQRPGYYKWGNIKRAVNLTPKLDPLNVLDKHPEIISIQYYAQQKEVTFGAWVIYFSLILVLADTVSAFILSGTLTKDRILRSGKNNLYSVALIAFCLLLQPRVIFAQSNQTPESYALHGAKHTRLAYILTGVDQTDEISRLGLTALSAVVRQRTAANLGSPMAVEPDKNELSFFPILYWPIESRQRRPSQKAINQLNRYLSNGGTILLDTRDQHLGERIAINTSALNSLVRGINIPPLTPIPHNHVLTKSFYLLKNFPGRWRGGRVWIDDFDNQANDGVSKVIVGGHDWAAGWATDARGQYLFPVIPGGEKQREMSYRFGINLVMYALTGNFKSDQVHVEAILKRFGQ